MGLSSNQARFLSLTSRQVDMEQRIQQICQRRLRLSSELENIATAYNNQISNRKFFVPQANSLESISIANLQPVGYKVMNMNTKMLMGVQELPVKSMGRDDMSTAAASDIASTGASATMVNLVANTAGLEFVNYMSTLRNADGTYKLTPTTAIAISSADAFKTLMTSGFNNNEGLNLNYVLMDNVDMSGFSWDSIGDNANAFSGIFDGNSHSLNNITINASTGYQGMFANVSGTVKNLDLNNTKMTINGGATQIANVGSISGYTTGTGKILNCHSYNMDMNINTNAPSGYDAVQIGGITGYVGAGGVVDLSSVSGSMDFQGINACDGVGGFIGVNASAAQINMSYSNVNITIPTGAPLNSSNVDCLNAFTGCDNASGLVINNCYAAGSIKYANGTYVPANGNTNAGLGHGLNTKVVNSWGNRNGTPYYWNGTVTGSLWGAASATQGAGFASSTAPNGQNIWTAATPLSINMAALSTFQYDGGTPTSAELEAGLRNGTYALVQDTDEFTQSTVKFYGSDYEVKDWRQTTEIYDELYKGDDVDAENKYDKTVSEINAQDKKLQLEQTSVEVEYKAVSSEKEAVKKILDTNAQSSFKYFS